VRLLGGAAFFDAILFAILTFIYALWRGGAFIVGVIEDVFMLFVGIRGTASGSVTDEDEAVTDIVVLIINNRVVQEIFRNLVAFATIMLIFFTIIKIIQEHYKDKHGGNPYVLVFRMVKAMVLFMFVTAACIVGLQLSNVVLSALHAATSGGARDIGGVIFGAMSSSANRVHKLIESPEHVANNTITGALVAHNTEKGWTWFDDFPAIYYGGNPNEIDEKEENQELWVVGELFTPYVGDSNVIDPQFEKFVVSNPDRIQLPQGGRMYAHHQMIRFDASGLVETETDDKGSTDNVVSRVKNRGAFRNPWHDTRATWVWENMPIFVEGKSGRAHFVHRWGGNHNCRNLHKGFMRATSRPARTTGETVERSNGSSTGYGSFAFGSSAAIRANHALGGITSIAGYETQADAPAIAGGDSNAMLNENNPNTYKYYVIMVGPDGRPRETTLRQYGFLGGSYFYLRGGAEWGERIGAPGKGVTLFAYWQVQHLAGISKAEDAIPWNEVDEVDRKRYATWLDTLMKRRSWDVDKSKDVPEFLIFYDDSPLGGAFGRSRDRYKHTMKYTNPVAVYEIYDLLSFNWIIGFGGLFIALGVYNSFAFGMIQRIAELGILYVFSPVTLAFFPFDDGAQFNNSFVKPFYKKAISSFAPVISLNLFFVILPAFDGIIWFDETNSAMPGTMNLVVGFVVSIALLSMLPKVRTTIQTMLGADPMEDKKMFGKGSVTADAWGKVNPKKHAENLQAMRTSAAMWANRRIANIGKKKDARKAEAARLAEEGFGKKAGKKNAATKDNQDAREKRLGKSTPAGAIRRAAARAGLKKKNLNAQIGADDTPGSKKLKGGLAGAMQRRAQSAKNAMSNSRFSNEGKKEDDALALMNKGQYGKALAMVNSNEALRNKVLGAAAEAAGHKPGLDGYKKFMKDNKFANQDMLKAAKNDGTLMTRKKAMEAEREAARKKMAKDGVLKAVGLGSDFKLDELNNATGEDAHNARVDWMQKAFGISNRQDALHKLNREGGKITADHLKEARKRALSKVGATKEWRDSLTMEEREKYDDLSKAVSKKDVKKRHISDKQKKLDLRQLQELKGAGNITKDQAWMKKLFDDDGKMLEGKELEKAWIDTLGRNKHHRKYQALADGGKGIAQGIGRGLKNTAKFAVNPFYAVDTVQGGLEKLRAQPNMFGSIMDGLFDPDNGILMQNGFAKTMDGFSFHKTFKSLDKWENAKTERLQTQGYAKGRTLRMAGMFADCERDLEEIEEQKRERLRLCGSTKEEAEAAVTKMKGSAIEAEAGIAEMQLAASPRLRTAYNELLSKAGKPGDPAHDHMKHHLNRLLNTGSKEEFKDAFGDNGVAFFEARKTEVLEKRKEEVEVKRKVISEYHTAKGLATKEDGETFMSQDEFIASKAKRVNQLHEYLGNAQRVLGISEEAKQELTRIKNELTGEGSLYIDIKRKYENKENPIVEIGGRMVTIDGPEAFARFQKEQFKDYEHAVNSKVNYAGVAFRDYGEKTGDRMDGILGATMASEQVKLMQDTIWKCDKNTHQLFCDPAFTDMMAGSKWMNLSDEFAKAARGEDCSFDKTKLAAITDKSQLTQLSNMFKDMVGDADGEMRGGGFSTANNIIARTFRMAFVDQITEALKATSTLLDQQQIQFMSQRDNGADELRALVANGKTWEKKVLKGLQINMFDKWQATDSAEYELQQTEVLKRLEQARKDNPGEISSVEYDSLRSKILSTFAGMQGNFLKKRETDAMNWRIRQLSELDFIARNMVARKDNKLQFGQGMPPIW
jgi:hypothetical protein